MKTSTEEVSDIFSVSTHSLIFIIVAQLDSIYIHHFTDEQAEAQRANPTIATRFVFKLENL